MSLFKKLLKSGKEEQRAKLDDLMAKAEEEYQQRRKMDPGIDKQIIQAKKNLPHQMTFHVAGVTFKDGRKSRQATLRKIRFNDVPFEKIETIAFERYEFNCEPAYYVQVNGATIGNIPKNRIEEFEKHMHNGLQITGFDVVGGGDEISYGCVITIKFNDCV